MFIKRSLTFFLLIILFFKISIFSSINSFLYFFLFVFFIGFIEWLNLIGIYSYFYKFLYIFFIFFIFYFFYFFYESVPLLFYIFLIWFFLFFHIFNLIYYYDYSILIVENIFIKFLFTFFLFFPLLVSLNVMCNYFTNDFFIGKMIVIYIFLLTFFSDTIGYIFGYFFGKKKLFKIISPNKTYFGTLSIFFFGNLLYFLLYFNKIFGSFDLFFILNLVILFFSVFGDLVISLYKRFWKIKNSGIILPGHGGVLDRIDSSLLSFSLVLYFL